MIRWMCSGIDANGFYTPVPTGEGVMGGGGFMSALDWVLYKCRQRLRLLTDNNNSTQLYQKRFSSRGTITSTTGDSPHLDPHQSWTLIPFWALIQILVRVVVSSRTGVGPDAKRRLS